MPTRSSCPSTARHLAHPEPGSAASNAAAGALPREHDAYLKLWHLRDARLPPGAEVLYLDEAQDANPVTLAILVAQRRPTVWVGDPWQSVYRFRGSVDAMRVIAVPQRHL